MSQEYNERTSHKINLDKYYTPPELAKRLIETTLKVLSGNTITDIIEPSAGNGSFSNQIECTAYDIEPGEEGINKIIKASHGDEGIKPQCSNQIIKADFLQLNIPYKQGRLCIGNPPFGHSNNMSIKFYKKCCEIGDYVAFIQPISQLNNNSQLYEFDLIYSEDLGTVSYSGRKLHCCFNIYKRPANGKLNKFKSTKDIMKNHPVLKHLTIKEYRRGSTSVDKIQEGWCVAFCSWGGHFGKVPKFIGEYPQETYIYVKEETEGEIEGEIKGEIKGEIEGEIEGRIKELFSYDNLRKIKFIAMRRISLARICNYIMDNW